MLQRYWVLPAHFPNSDWQHSLLNIANTPVSSRGEKSSTDKPPGSHQSRGRQTLLVPHEYDSVLASTGLAWDTQLLPTSDSPICSSSLWICAKAKSCSQSLSVYTHTPKAPQKSLIHPSPGKHLGAQLASDRTRALQQELGTLCWFPFCHGARTGSATAN